MRSSLDKDRDIARSILPSTSRQQARQASAHAKRRTRHRVRADLRGLTRAYAADPEAWLDHLGDPFETSDTAVRQVMYRRRGADKLNHFERWAVMRTRTLPPADRRSYLRSILPGGLIGDHAMSHIDRIQFLGGEQYAWWRGWFRGQRMAHEAKVAWLRLVRAGLLDALEFGEHAGLNRALRRPLDGHDTVTIAPIAGDADVERLLARLSGDVHAPASTMVRRRVISALDEVVEGWRLLRPVAGDADPAFDPWIRRQSWAAGLSWLPPAPEDW